MGHEINDQEVPRDVDTFRICVTMGTSNISITAKISESFDHKTPIYYLPCAKCLWHPAETEMNARDWLGDKWNVWWLCITVSADKDKCRLPGKHKDEGLIN